MERFGSPPASPIRRNQKNQFPLIFNRNIPISRRTTYMLSKPPSNNGGTRQRQIRDWFYPSNDFVPCFLCRENHSQKYCQHRYYCELCSGKIETCTLCESRLDQEQQFRMSVLNEYLIPEISVICVEYIPTRFKVYLHIHELNHDGYCSGAELEEEERKIEYMVPLHDDENIELSQNDNLLQTDSVKEMNMKYRVCGGSGYCGGPSSRTVEKVDLM